MCCPCEKFSQKGLTTAFQSHGVKGKHNLITFSNVAAAPPISSNGDSAICAFLTAVTVFVNPRANKVSGDHKTIQKLKAKFSIMKYNLQKKLSTI